MGAGGDDADGMALVDTHRPAEAPGTATSNSDIRVGLTFWQEAAQQLKLAWPVIVAYVLQMSLGIVNLLFVGHLDNDASIFAAASLATMFANVTGFSIGIGMATAMDTLCAQAYGAGQFKELGRVMQRGILILGLTCIPIVTLWCFAEPLLILARQDPMVASKSGHYVLGFIPGLWPNFIFEAEKKYLQAQGRTIPQMVVTGITAMLNPLFAYLFVVVLGFGFIGAPLAVSCSSVVLAVGGAIACAWCRDKDPSRCTWGGWSRTCLKGWWPFLKLAGPGTVMVCAEWWSFEVVAIGAGWLGTIELAVQGVMMNTVALVFMLPLGIGVAASIRVGNLIGAGHGKAARQAAFVAIGLGVFMEVCENSVLAWQRTHWGEIWTDSEAVAELTASVILVAVCFDILDGVQAVTSGVLRGVGKQHVGAVSNLAAYIVVGIPCAFLFAFKFGLGIYGLWMGLAVALVLQASILCTFLCRIDWQAQVVAARARLAASNTQGYATVGDEGADGAGTVEMAGGFAATSDDDGESVLNIDDDDDDDGGGGGGGGGGDFGAAHGLDSVSDQVPLHRV